MVRCCLSVLFFDLVSLSKGMSWDLSPVQDPLSTGDAFDLPGKINFQQPGRVQSSLYFKYSYNVDESKVIWNGQDIHSKTGAHHE